MRRLRLALSTLRRRFLPPTRQRAVNLVQPYTMLNPHRLFSLWHQVRDLGQRGVPGALVECGVWKGGAVAMMALADDTGRDLHLFDAFDDICEPDPEVDGERALREVRERAGIEAQGRMQSVAGIYDFVGGHGTVGDCQRLLDRVGVPSERQHFHVGWFQDTVPEAQTGPIALLRIDGDWYASTKVCLEHLYERVSPGGWVVIDDYFAYDGCQLAVDEFRLERGIDVALEVIDPQTALAWRVPSG